MRGMHQIRSTSGKMTRAAVAKESKDYQLYMQITCLEMEKVRRGVERAAAIARVRSIDARLHAVEVEKEALLCKLAARGSSVPESAVSASATALASFSDAAPAGSFHIRY